MKNRILAAVFFILLAGLLVYFWWHPVPEKKSLALEIKNSQDATVAGALAKLSPRTVAIIESNFTRVHPAQESLNPTGEGISTAPAGQPAPLQFTNFGPAIVLENMSRAIRQFGTMFGGNPVGTNPEITSQLTGNNPKHINFLNAEAGMRVNENAELVDPWGTPYFFHQLSGTDMEVRSAGPDKIMWTSDDLVVK
jgi:hypothetical protein